MIMNGLEGVHYVRRENSMIIDYPEGIDATNTPYSNVLGLYGDKRKMCMFVPNDYANEIAAVTSVMRQYLSSME